MKSTDQFDPKRKGGNKMEGKDMWSAIWALKSVSVHIFLGGTKFKVGTYQLQVELGQKNKIYKRSDTTLLHNTKKT